MTHKAGFVSIIGYPNTGKSTLMNSLLGERLSIVSPKAQTTRHRIMGILSGEDFQIVYSDTPGMIRPHYLLQQYMVSAVFASLDDADVIVFLADVTELPDEHDRRIEDEHRNEAKEVAEARRETSVHQLPCTSQWGWQPVLRLNSRGDASLRGR